MSGTLKPHTRVHAKIFAIVKINTNKSELSKYFTSLRISKVFWVGWKGGGGVVGVWLHTSDPQELYKLKNFYTYPKVEFKIL